LGRPSAPNQAAAVDDALKAIPVNEPRQIGLENSHGTLEPGTRADLRILKSDPNPK
jgi:imidazolonepropionase-like amidohydrolase